jgi:hypothetical protein
MFRKRDPDRLPAPAVGRLVRSADQLYRRKHRRLYDYWQSLRPEGHGLPSRRDIDPLEIPDLLANLWLTDVVSETGTVRFRERLVGTTLARLYGRDTTGKFFEEIYAGEHLARQLATYRAVVEHALPHLARLRVPLADRDFIIYDRLMLPLASDTRTPDMIIGIHAYRREPGEDDRADPEAELVPTIPDVQIAR